MTESRDIHRVVRDWTAYVYLYMIFQVVVMSRARTTI